MHIEKLSLINFKNYEELTLNFSKKVNCILGKNGSGKTNLLDAIYYLSSTKSAFNAVDSQNIKFEESFFAIRSNLFADEKEYKVECILKEGQKKLFKVNGVEYEKLREHVGRFPVVFIAPNDTDLIREGSEIRRKFFDHIISQTDREYLDKLIEYNHYLKQRNSLLKRFAENDSFDRLLLEPYDNGLISTGEFLHKKREVFVKPYKKHLLTQFEKLTKSEEEIDLVYQSDCSKSGLKELLNRNLKKDLILQRTTTGLHKDDYKFLIKGKPLKKFGSQGQQKSFVIGLKLAHYLTLKKFKSFTPVLLLDDVFDKLDSSRIEKLIKMMIKSEFGQVFITDARSERTRDLLKDTVIQANFYEISEGKIEEAHEEKERL